MLIDNKILSSFSAFLQELLAKKYPATRPRITITVIDGAQKRIFDFEETPITIGRAVTNDVELNDKFVSREHAQIIFENDQFYLKDLGSTNGTFLNKQRLGENSEALLHDGDVIILERFKLITSIQYPARMKHHVELALVSVNQTPFNQFALSLSMGSLISRFDMPPFDDDIFLELDKNIINALSQQASLKTSRHRLKSLSAREQVHELVENIILDLLDFLDREYGKQIDFRVLFSGFQKDFTHVTASIENDDQIILVDLKIIINSNSGFVRLVLPSRLKDLFQAGLSKKYITTDLEEGPSWGANARVEKFSRIQGLTAFLTIEIGSIKMSSLELMELEAEHLLEFDQIMISFNEDEIAGKVRLRLPDNVGNYWIGHFIHENDKVKIKIIDEGTSAQTTSDISAHIIESPTASEPSMNDDSHPEQNIKTNKGLANKETQFIGHRRRPSKFDKDMLKEISIPISVELGRIKLSVQEILSLRPGQTIELTHPLSRSVNLMINNRLVAKGKLVKQADSFAVKILKIANAK